MKILNFEIVCTPKQGLENVSRINQNPNGGDLSTDKNANARKMFSCFNELYKKERKLKCNCRLLFTITGSYYLNK